MSEQNHPPSVDGESAEILSLAQAQYKTAGTIYGSTDPAEILDALVNFIGVSYERAHIGLIDDELQPPLLNILAEYKDKRVTISKRQTRLDDYPAYETFSAVEVLDIEDVDVDPFLVDEERQLLRENDVRAMLIIPMVVTQRLIGLIVFQHNQPVTLTQQQLRALRSLADQTAVVFENQALLRDTESSLEEVRTLYNINKEMLSAVDTTDMLRVLRQLLAPTADKIMHIGVVAQENHIGYTIQHISTPTSEQTVNTPLALDINSDVEGTTIDFIEKTEENHHPLYDALQIQGAASYVVITLRSRQTPTDIIVITFDALTPFDSRTQRLYSAVADQIEIVLENQRLLQETQQSAIQMGQQLRTLRILNELALGVTEIKDEAELLEYGVEKITTTLNVDHGGLMLVDAGGATSTVVAEYPAVGTLGTQLELTNSPLARIMEENQYQTIVLADIATEDRIPEPMRVMLSQQLGIQGMVILPILLQEKLIGSIGLDIFERGRKFDPEIIQSAQTMTAQLAIALQNVRLQRETNRRATQLEHIAAFGQSVQATLDEESIYSVFFTECLPMLNPDTISVVLYNGGSDQLNMVARTHQGITELPHAPVPKTNPLLNKAWQTQEIIAIPDTGLEPELYVPIPNILEDVRSILIAPIRVRRQPVGMVIVSHETIRGHTAIEIALFEQMVNLLGVAIENSRNYAQTVKAVTHEAFINELSAQLQQINTLEGMLQVTIKELGQVLNARRGRIKLSTGTMPQGED